jgi:2-iminobutanoate/2-iminopropanoate deaminase
MIMENIKAVLAAAGSSIDRVIKATVFLRDLNDCGIMNETYWSYFQENFPARSVGPVAKLRRGAAVEIEALALAQDR